jgi:hypothetical protein
MRRRWLSRTFPLPAPALAAGIPRANKAVSKVRWTRPLVLVCFTHGRRLSLEVAPCQRPRPPRHYHYYPQRAPALSLQPTGGAQWQRPGLGPHPHDGAAEPRVVLGQVGAGWDVRPPVSCWALACRGSWVPCSHTPATSCRRAACPAARRNGDGIIWPYDTYIGEPSAPALSRVAGPAVGGCSLQPARHRPSPCCSLHAISSTTTSTSHHHLNQPRSHAPVCAGFRRLGFSILYSLAAVPFIHARWVEQRRPQGGGRSRSWSRGLPSPQACPARRPSQPAGLPSPRACPARRPAQPAGQGLVAMRDAVICWPSQQAAAG